MRIYAVYPEVGTRFGSLIVTGAPFILPGVTNHARVIPCRCDCGCTDTARLSRLMSSSKVACKRCSWSAANRTHGDRASVEYTTWCKVRCRAGLTSVTSLSPAARRAYRDKGITMCRRWLSYAAFLSDMGRRPPGCSLDRKNNRLGYSPKNCRWATAEEQANNRSSSILVVRGNDKLSIAQWERKLGFRAGTLAARYRVGDRSTYLFRQSRQHKPKKGKK